MPAPKLSMPLTGVPQINCLAPVNILYPLRRRKRMCKAHRALWSMGLLWSEDKAHMEDKGGQGRNVFCALVFYNHLIIFHIRHHPDVKHVDLALKQNKKYLQNLRSFYRSNKSKNFRLQGHSFLSKLTPLNPSYIVFVIQHLSTPPSPPQINIKTAFLCHFQGLNFD